MRAIERSPAFKRDYKRAKAAPRHRENVDLRLSAVLERLISDMVLPENSRDHPLSGDWNGYRECHVKPDLLLIYRKVDEETLCLVRLGSHSELFG